MAYTSANGSSATNSNPGTPTGDLSPLLTTTGLLMEVRCSALLGSATSAAGKPFGYAPPEPDD